MWHDVWPTVLGFMLTTIVGGVFASYLQQRSWQHQNDLRIREDERQRASDVCRNLSSLVDRRWYLMQRLLAAISARANQRVTGEALAERLAAYQVVVDEWNNELNARLAVVGVYFGTDVRDFLDRTVYEEFAGAGKCLESLYRTTTSQGPIAPDSTAFTDASTAVGRLNNLAYQLSFIMMVRIRDGRVGAEAPNVLTERG